MFSFLLRFLPGTFLVLSGAGKVLRFRSHADGILRPAGLSRSVWRSVVAIVGTIEVFLALGLVAGLPGFQVGVAVLLFAVTPYGVVAVRKGYSCGCAVSRAGWTSHSEIALVVRNCVLLALSIAGSVGGPVEIEDARRIAPLMALGPLAVLSVGILASALTAASASRRVDAPVAAVEHAHPSK